MTRFSTIVQFNQLFNQYYQRFVLYAIGYVKDEAIAEDFVSEAFAIYWENMDTLSAETQPSAYIFTVVRNKCLNHLRREQVKHRVEKHLSEHAEWVLSTRISTLHACDPEYLFSQEIQHIIDKTLAKLPRKTRTIFILSRYKGLSNKEIAEKMQLSVKAVEFHITKALTKLRFSLRDFSYIFFL